MQSNLKKRTFFIISCYICGLLFISGINLSAQISPIDTLPHFSTSISISQKIHLRNTIQNFLEEITSLEKRTTLSQKYFEAAISSQDSFFLTHSSEQLALISAVTSDTFKYQLQGNQLISKSALERIYLQENIWHLLNFIGDKNALSNFERHQLIASEYGIHTSELRTDEKLDLYNFLKIYKANNHNTSFENFLKSKPLFENNNTLTEFDSEAVYWIQLKLRGGQQQIDTCSFFIENMEEYSSWNNIEAYLVHEDGQVDQEKTGNLIPLEEKSPAVANNIVRFEIQPNENVTMYLRLCGAEGKRAPRWVSLLGTRRKNLHQTDLYQTNGTFKYSNGFTPFRGNKLNTRRIFTDTSKQKTIAYIAENWDKLSYGDGYATDFSEPHSYWTRVRLIGNTAFNGPQFFHTAPYPFVGADAFNFNNIDYYYPNGAGGFSHQRTGFKVPMSERPYDFWANFIKVEVSYNDTLDLYIRLEGSNPRFIMNRLDLWHIDPASIFPNQMNEGIKNGLFYGVLGIQFLFFILLFGIEKDRIHFYFSIVVLGVFLTQGFGEDNFRYFVPFPAFRDYHSALFFSGLFLVQVGFLKFTSSYFNFSKTSFISRFFIPIFLMCSAVVNFYAATQFSYSNFSEYPVGKLYYILAIVFMFAGILATFLIGLLAKVKTRTPKIFFIVAFLPGLMTGMFFLLRVVVGGILGNSVASNLFPPFIFSYDAIKISIIAMLFLLALSMGYRTKLLKTEKQKALEQNLKSQQIIIEKLQQTDRLEALDQLKTRFFTNITHEFRTPLTVILGIADQLGIGSWVNKVNAKERVRLAEGFEMISRNGNKLLRLINQLLDLSKLDNQKLKPNYQPKEVVSFIQYVGESFESLANRKDVRLTIYSEIDKLYMEVDEIKLQQIISNILSNAIKFTKARGKVVLHLSQKENLLQLKIKDTGEGIPKETLPFVFDRFYQVDNPSSRKGEGTGIGLSLVKELVELLEGEIEVKSEMGMGTEFIIWLPIRAVDAQLVADFEVSDLSKKRFDKIGLENGKEVIADTETKPIAPAQDKPHLLIAEDNPDVIFYIRSILENFYNIIIASDGQEGINQALEHIPDIIISDVMMPRKNGFELVETLKQDERTSHIPIILLTAKATHEDKLDGLKFGADAYLMKPFDKEELLIRVENLLQIRQAIQSKYMNGSQFQEKTPRIIIKTIEDVFIEKINTVLEKKYTDSEFKVQDFAKSLNMNYHQLNRKLKALTNQTPTHYMRSFRLQKGLKLLSESKEMNISEIAYEVGFESVNYFSRAFSKEYGKSPNEVRK